jgi:hypothetical protein
MATFPVNPTPFVPEGMAVDHGPADRKVRSDMVVPAIAPLQHDRVLIAETSRFIPVHLREMVRESIRDMLVESGHIVRYFDDHPFGIGVFTFPETLVADAVVNLSFELDDEITVTLVRHDPARNMRLTTFGRETWILFLGFPLDYQTEFHINNAVRDFGEMSIWHNPRGNKKFVLVKVWIVDPKFVPRSLVMHQLGGARRSWTVPVFILRNATWTAHIHDVPPPPEDPAPANGNPHPMHGPEVTAE